MASKTQLRVGTLLAVILAGLATAAGAVADSGGSSSITSAAVVHVGQQEFGDNSCCQSPDHDYIYDEWWRLHVIAGDHVRLTYQYSPQSGGLGQIAFWPAGTTNFNLGSERPVASLTSNSLSGLLTAKGELNFVAPHTGLMPFDFFTNRNFGSPTSYDFTVYVRHVVRLFLPGSPLTRSASLLVGVHAPDGTPITDPEMKATLRGYWSKRWHSLGKASPQQGLARFRLHLPPAVRGKTVEFRVQTAATGYLRSSATRSLRVR